MDVRTELEQDPRPSEGLERAAPASAAPPPASERALQPARPLQPGRSPLPAPHTVGARHVLEEASFLVVESGRIRFFVHPRVAAAAPTSLGDVERVSFTLAPRNRSVARRVSLSERQMPDDRGGERVTAHVDRVGAPEPDAGPRRSRRARGARERAGAIEVARGTYAITSHRDHAHLMYELDGESAVSYAALLHLLRVAPRASYVALVQNPESRWRVRDREQGPAPSSGARPRGGSAGRMDDDLDKRRFMPLDPVFLDHEGTELVLLGGRVVVGREPRDACGRP